MKHEKRDVQFVPGLAMLALHDGDQDFLSGLLEQDLSSELSIIRLVSDLFLFPLLVVSSLRTAIKQQL